jgi:hypothetical protein
MTQQGPIIVMLLTAAIGTAQTASPEAALGAAIHLEEVEGNYTAAIAAYRKFVAQHGGQKALAAKAQFRLGSCQEKLGNAEARKAYERVLTEYGDQKPYADEARAKLAALGVRNGGMQARQIEMGGPIRGPLALSPEGERAYLLDPKTGALMERDLRTGRSKRLTAGNGSGEYIGRAAVSRSGRQLAYARTDSKRFHARMAPWAELRVLTLDGGQTRTVYTASGPGEIHASDWDADGERILAVLQRGAGPGSRELAWINVKDGTAKTIYSAPAIEPGTARVSPDGAWVAVVTNEGQGQREIRVIPAGGGAAMTVAAHPADDSSPIWSRAGDEIYFLSTRTGGPALWSVKVKSGREAGAAELRKADFGEATLQVALQGGSILYEAHRYYSDTWTAAAGGGGAREMESRMKGGNLNPSWSPSGEELAFMRFQAGGRKPSVLVVRNVGTGADGLPEKGVLRQILENLT